MKYKSIVHKRFKSIYYTEINVHKKVKGIAFFIDKVYLDYDADTNTFNCTDLFDSIPVPNLSELSEEEEFQYSLVYEDIWELKWDYYRMLSYQKALVSSIKKQNYLLINLEY